jgi:uncharacterized protein (DUF2147 family)
MKMKKIILAAIFMICSSSLLFAQNSTNANEIVGVWLSEKKDGKVEIFKQGDKYFGKLFWGKTMFENDGITSKKDVNNTDAKLKNRNLKDLIILTNFVFDDGVWNGGKIYDPEVGKTYSCTMKLKNNILKIRGYVGISLFGRTSEWTRIK